LQIGEIGRAGCGDTPAEVKVYNQMNFPSLKETSSTERVIGN
jgi:hypothetical protein